MPSRRGELAGQRCGAAAPLPPGSLFWGTRAQRCSVQSRAIPAHRWLRLSSRFRRGVSCCTAASLPGIQERPRQPLRGSCPRATPTSRALRPTSPAGRWFTESHGLCLGPTFPEAAGFGPAADRSPRSAVQQQEGRAACRGDFGERLRSSGPRNGTLPAGKGRMQPGALRLAPANTFRKYGFLIHRVKRESFPISLPWAEEVQGSLR